MWQQTGCGLEKNEKYISVTKLVSDRVGYLDAVLRLVCNARWLFHHRIHIIRLPKSQKAELLQIILQCNTVKRDFFHIQHWIIKMLQFRLFQWTGKEEESSEWSSQLPAFFLCYIRSQVCVWRQPHQHVYLEPLSDTDQTFALPASLFLSLSPSVRLSTPISFLLKRQHAADTHCY